MNSSHSTPVEGLKSQADITSANPESADGERDMWPAIMRGWRCRCPACGAGQIFKGYLKAHDNCPSCGEELYHHRADDGPAYLTLIVVGHIMAPVMLYLFAHWEPNPLITATILSLAFAGMCLYLLPKMKGGFIGLQWAKRMHGFRHVAPKASASAKAE